MRGPLSLVDGEKDPLKDLFGVVPNHSGDEEERQQQPQHGSVFGQGLPLLGAEEFSTKAVNA
jgi:hypothetical protein